MKLCTTYHVCTGFVANALGMHWLGDVVWLGRPGEGDSDLPTNNVLCKFVCPCTYLLFTAEPCFTGFRGALRDAQSMHMSVFCIYKIGLQIYLHILHIFSKFFCIFCILFCIFCMGGKGYMHNLHIILHIILHVLYIILYILHIILHIYAYKNFHFKRVCAYFAYYFAHYFEYSALCFA